MTQTMLTSLILLFSSYCQAICLDSFRDWKAAYIEFRQQIQKGEEIVNDLSIKSDQITEVLGNITGTGDMGSNPGGVFLVRTSSGLKALKILPRDWSDRIDLSSGRTNLQRDEVILQNFLTRYNLSLPVVGILTSSEMNQLFSRFPQLKENLRHIQFYGKATWVAYLMDYLPNAYNPKKRGQTYLISEPPLHSRSWDIQRMLVQTKKIAKVRDLLGIHLIDAQILVSESGEIYAIDFGLETVLHRDDTIGARFNPPTDVTATENTYTNIIQMFERHRR